MNKKNYCIEKSDPSSAKLDQNKKVTDFSIHDEWGKEGHVTATKCFKFLNPKERPQSEKTLDLNKFYADGPKPQSVNDNNLGYIDQQEVDEDYLRKAYCNSRL